MDAATLINLLSEDDITLLNKTDQPKVFVYAARRAFDWSLDQVHAAVEVNVACSRRNIDRLAAGGGAHPATMRALRRLVGAAEDPVELRRFMNILREHSGDN